MRTCSDLELDAVDATHVSLAVALLTVGAATRLGLLEVAAVFATEASPELVL